MYVRACVRLTAGATVFMCVVNNYQRTMDRLSFTLFPCIYKHQSQSFSEETNITSDKAGEHAHTNISF